MTAHADVAVVGGGPAGAATARFLALAGWQVVLLERRPFPRAKPCGDCLSPRAACVLDRLGLLEAALAEAPARLEGWRIVSAGGHAFTGTFAPAARGDPRLATALALPRDRLDRVLLDGARDAGADIRTGVHVTALIHGSGGQVAGVAGRDADGRPIQVRARLVIGADGLRSVVARRLGLIRRRPRLRKLSFTLHLARAPDPGALGEMHLADGASAGFAPVGTTATPGTRPVNLTLVVDPARFRPGSDALAFFWSTLERFPELRPRLPSLREAARAGGGHGGDDAERPRLLASGPFDWPTRRVTADGAALAGDAAGYFDPFTGQGIYHALAGATLLAETAAAALARGTPSAARLEPYGRAHRRLVTESRLLQRIVEAVTARPAAADAVFRRLAEAPAAADALIAAAGDIVSPRSLLRPAILFSFLLPRTTTGGAR